MNTHDKFVSTSFKLGISPDMTSQAHMSPLFQIKLNQQERAKATPLIILQKMQLALTTDLPKVTSVIDISSPHRRVINASSYLAVDEAMFGKWKSKEKLR